MKKMIKNSLLAMTLLFGSTIGISTSFAEELKIIIPSDPSGGATIRFKAIEDDLKKAWGDNVEFVWTGNCANGVNTIKNTTGPWISIWWLDMNMVDSCKNIPTKQQIIAVDSSPFRICVRKDSKLTLKDFTSPGKDIIRLGHPSPMQIYQSWISGFNSVTNGNIQSVPYNSSGKALKGLIAGDIDAVLISPPNANKLMKNNNGICIASTDPNGESKYNLPALADHVDFKFNILQSFAYYFVGNMDYEDTQKIKDLFVNLTKGSNPNFLEYQKNMDSHLKSEQEVGIDGLFKLLNNELKLYTELMKN